MGEQSTTKFPQEILDQWAGLGLDLPALFSAGHLGERMSVRVIEAAPDRVVGTMPVEGNTQPYGLLHGGASAVLAETLGSVGSMLHGGPHKLAVGVDLNCTHHRGTPLRPGHRRRHPRPPRPLHRHLRNRDHRRAGQAGLHRPPHLHAARRRRRRVPQPDAPAAPRRRPNGPASRHRERGRTHFPHPA